MLKKKKGKQTRDVPKENKKPTANLLDDADRSLRKKGGRSYRTRNIINYIYGSRKRIALIAILGFYIWYRFFDRPKA